MNNKNLPINNEQNDNILNGESQSIESTKNAGATRSSLRKTDKQSNSIKNTLPWIIIAISILALLTAIGIYIYNNHNNDDKKATPSTTTPISTRTTPKNTDETSKMPLLEQYANAPKAQTTTTTVDIKNNVITTSDNNTLKFNDNSKVLATSQKCSVSNSTDFCQVASGKNDKTKESFDIYYLKDAAHSRLFENPIDFTKVNIIGSPSSGTMKIDLGGSKANILTIVNKNSSGWLIVMNNNANSNNITKAAAIG